MAKYELEIKHSCGHTAIAHFEARPRDVDYRIKCLEEQLCPECLEKEEEAYYQKIKAENEAEGFAELSGSPKQIRWAEDIRCSLKRSFAEWKEEQEDIYFEDDSEASRFLATLDAYCDAVEKKFKSITSASWFIDRNHGMDWSYAFGLQIDDFEKEPEKTEILSPENQSHPGTAAVMIVNDWLTAAYIRDDAFIAAVKAMGFRWNPENQVWRRRKDVADSSLIDAAAETAAALIEKGFAVEASDVVADMVKAGSYAPATRRIISVLTSNGKQSFLIRFEPDAPEALENDLYVFPSSWETSKRNEFGASIRMTEEVADLADLWGFTLSPMATKVIEEARENATTVSGIKRKKSREKGGKEDVLSSSREVLDDLKD